MNSNNINSLFNIGPQSDPQKTSVIVQDASDDYEYVRTRLKDMIDVTTDLFNGALETARAADDAKTYDAISKLVIALTGANKTLADVNIKRAEIEKAKEKDKPTTQNNLIMVGSTKDLQELIANAGKNIIIEGNDGEV